ncbi:hypothetical protein Tco_1494445 [Tanacetum coccineum]
MFLPFMVSDRSPSMLIIPSIIAKKNKSFRFAIYVADNPNFLDTVKGVWDKQIKGCVLYRVVQKLKQLKKPLNQLNWSNGNIFEKTVALKEKLKEAQTAEDEIKLLHQKVKIKWLSEGDRNTAYFHRVLKARKDKSIVESICMEDGNRDNGSDVPEKFVNQFNMFLGSSMPVSPLNSLGNIVNLKLSQEEAEDMVIEVSDEEIKSALFDIDSSKAAGPDAYSTCFYKNAWVIVGKEICLAIKEFF